MIPTKCLKSVYMTSSGEQEIEEIEDVYAYKKVD